MKRIRLVVVTWKDAHGSPAQFKKKDHAPLIMTTVGWLLCQDDRGLSIANERQEDGVYRGQTFIPSGMIQHIKTIRTRQAV